MSKQYFTYILTNPAKNVLYIGITNDLVRRMYEYKNKLQEGFTKKYNVDILVYYETYEYPEQAIIREKQIKNLVRRKKEDLITNKNHDWKDLYKEII